jgi:hypothetical protein
VRVLLLSTYELGHQPLGLAGPARLLDPECEVRCRDLSVEQFGPADIAWADAVAISVPMHTALRLALEVVATVRASRPDIPVALFGLYAGVAKGAADLGPGDLLAAGEYADELLEWLARAARDVATAGSGRSAAAGTVPAGSVPGELQARGRVPGPRIKVSLGSGSRSKRGAPQRKGLPALEQYAQLSYLGESRLAGYVEATRGCSHRCRHCPVPTVYAGRTRVVDVADVVDDVASLVELGAEHITFGDPDFLNRPAHSLEVVRAVHANWPGLSFDATVKVEHVLRHVGLWPELAGSGCLFVVSAFESVDDRVLALLDKGHTAEDAARAVEILRASGIEPRPSLLPFTPWTAIGDMAVLLDFVAAHDLVWNVDPVQYGIRLLLPPGSLLLTDPDPQLAASLDGFDPVALSWRWHSAEAAVDELAGTVAAIAEQAAAALEPLDVTFERVRAAAREAAGLSGVASRQAQLASSSAAAIAGPQRPRLTESWFCCAEPTSAQLEALAGR